MPYELYTADGAGVHLLASGADLAPGSLAIAGKRIYWLQGSTTFSTLLP